MLIRAVDRPSRQQLCLAVDANEQAEQEVSARSMAMPDSDLRHRVLGASHALPSDTAAEHDLT
jgi:hypothetical protein